MDHPRLLVGTDDGLVMLGPRPGRRLGGRAIGALASSGASRWAVADGRDLLRSRAGGPWRQVTTLDGGRATCVLGWRGGGLVGLAGGRLLRFTTRGVEPVVGFDRAPGRAAWFTPWGAPADTRSLARGADRALYVNVHVGGVLRSRDAGRSWRPTVAIETDVHQVLAHPRRPGIVLAPGAVGLGISRDGGDTWAFETRGFHAVYQRAVALVGEVILVSTSRSERGREAAVYRRPLAGRGAFRRCARGLPRWFAGNVDTGCLAGAAPWAAIGTPDGAVFLSRDHGATWRAAAEGLGRVRCLAFA